MPTFLADDDGEAAGGDPNEEQLLGPVALQPEEPSLLPTAGNISAESVEFKQLYLNVTADISPLPRHPCDLQAVLEDTERNRPRSFTTLNSDKMWTNAKVRWNFVSDHDNKFSVLKDENIGT